MNQRVREWVNKKEKQVIQVLLTVSMTFLVIKKLKVNHVLIPFGNTLNAYVSSNARRSIGTRLS